MKTLIERIARGEAAIAAAKAVGRDVRAWEEHLERLKGEAQTQDLDDPVVPVEAWYPEFHRLHLAVVVESPDFDYRWLKENRPELHAQIKAIEDFIDATQEARLSEILALIRGWRELVLRADFEQQRFFTNRAVKQ